MCENQIPMMPQEYDVKVREYGPGMIVWHTCPLDKADAYNVGAMSARPVLIVGQERVLGASRYQVMALSSNLNNFGIRILSPNFEDPNSPDWKPGVILCMEVWTVHRNSLERIIGCVPSRTLEKCVKAYSWVLGLTDEIPNFIRMSEEAMLMLGDGNPAKYIPVSLRGTQTNAPIFTPPTRGSAPLTPKPVNGSMSVTADASASDTNTPAPPEQKEAPKYDHPVLERIEKFQSPPPKLSPANRLIADNLSINEQFDLFVGRTSVRKLAATKEISIWAGQQIAKYVNYRNLKGTQKLIDDIKDQVQDVRYLTGRNEMLYRMINKSQMHSIRRSPKGYQHDISRFGLDYFKDTVIGIAYGATIF